MTCKAPLSIGVMVSGRGTNLQAVLDGCENGSIPGKVVVVVSNREGVLALERAASKGVPAFAVPPKKFGKWPECRPDYEKEVIRILKDHGVELLVLAGYDRLVGDDILNAFPSRVINIHPALLPSFPGLTAQEDALAYGVKVAGATVFFVDPTMDGGPIILQEAVRVEEDDTVETLSARILEVEHRILTRAITLIANGQTRIEGRRVRILEATSSEKGCVRCSEE